MSRDEPQGTLEILRDARALIADPKRWTRRAFARDGRSRQVDPQSPRAVRYCATGALFKASGDNEVRDALAALQAVLIDQGWTVSIEVFNDDYAGHADVLALFDRAIADLEREGAQA